MVSKTLLMLVTAATGLAVTGAVTAGTDCNVTLLKSLHEAERIVYSLRPDKAGQARVFAIDGTEYTGGEALWMKAQLRAADEACAHGDDVQAAKRLHAVQATLKSHRSA